MKNLIIIGVLASMFCITASARAQAMPTATAAGGLQIGGGYSYVKPDYGTNSWQGFTGFADFDFASHLGIEADVHSITLITPDDLAEVTYLVGPRFIFPHHRFKFYAKGLAGDGDMVAQEQTDTRGVLTGNVFAYSIGGGVEYVASQHIVVRALDVEYQHWSYLNGLTPTVFTVGVAYRLR